MATPSDEINNFLDANGTADAKRLDVSLAFAHAMVRELRATVAEWEITAAALQEAGRRLTAPAEDWRR